MEQNVSREQYFTPSRPEKLWDELYQELKSGRYGSIREANNHNPLNAAILGGAPHKVLELMINIADKSLLLSPSSKNKNITLHYLLGTPTDMMGDKKEIDHSLVRLVMKKAPESFHMKNERGNLPINLITIKNYNEVRLIMEDAIYNEQPTLLNSIFHNMPSDVIQRLLDDATKYVNKNKLKLPHYRALLLTFEAMKKEINNIRTTRLSTHANKSAEELIKEEEKQKQKDLKRAEIAEKVRIAKIEQERKHMAALQIQKEYRGVVERRKYQEYLKQKGLNKKAVPFVPIKKVLEQETDDTELLAGLPRSIDELHLRDILPMDAEIKHPWRPVKEHWKTFNFGNVSFSKKSTTSTKLKKLKGDLKLLSRM